MIWISLDKPLVWRVPARASKETLPLSRLDDWDLEEGRPRIINWSEQADWYDRQLHWRGWIPEGIIGSPIVPKPVKKLLPYDPAKGALKGSSVLSKNTLDAAYRLNTLRNGLKVFLSDLTACSIPVPEEVDLPSLQEPCTSSARLLTALCRFCYGIVDLIGFFRWAACVFEREIDSQNTPHNITQTYKWLGENFPGKSIGYLIHLEAHHREFGFRLCLKEGVPFYYPWFNRYNNNPRFSRFKPEILSASLPDIEIPPSYIISDFRPYDQYLQKSGGLNNKTVKLVGLPKCKPFVVDFEGWIRRSLRKEERLSEMKKRYYWEDCATKGGKEFTRIFMLWRVKDRDEEDSEDEQRPSFREEYSPIEPDIFRERHKFLCAPSEGEAVDPFLHQRLKNNAPSLALRLQPSPEDFSLLPIGQSASQLQPPPASPAMPLSTETPRSVDTAPLSRLDLEKLFEGPATSSQNLGRDEPPLLPEPMDEDRISLVANDELNALELEGWQKALEAGPPMQKSEPVSTPRPSSQATPISPRAASSPIHDLRAPLEDRITSESSLQARLEVEAEMGVLPGKKEPRERSSKGSKPVLLSRVGGRPPIHKEIQRGKATSLADRLRTPDMEEGPAMRDVPNSRDMGDSLPSMPNWRNAKRVPEADLLLPIPTRKPAHSVRRVDSSTKLSSPQYHNKGKSRATEEDATTTMDISLVDCESTAMVWEGTQSDGWGPERASSSRSGWPPTSSWGEAVQDKGWDTWNAWKPTSPLMAGGEWEGTTSVWTEKLPTTKSPVSMSVGSEGTSGSTQSKRPRPPSREEGRLIEKRKSEFKSSALPSSTMVRLRESYLQAAVPLTPIDNALYHSHPHLSQNNLRRARWNPQYLRWAIVRFPDIRSEVKFRLWVLFAGLSPAELLIRAFERHLPISLPIQTDQASLFTKTNYSEIETRTFYYSPGFRTPVILFDPDGRQLWNNYRVAVADLLLRPHARALVFKGGLISRLVKALAPKEFFDGLLYGPSAQVTRHNKGLTNAEDGTVDDEMSSYDEAVILGVTTTPPGRDKDGVQSIWPPKNMFEEVFRGWDGEWNRDCEEWFRESWQRREGCAKVRTGREWNRCLKRDRIPNLVEESKKVPAESWDTAVVDLRTNMTSLWPSGHLSDLRLPRDVEG